MKLIFNLSMTQTFLYHITTKEQSTPPSVKFLLFSSCVLCGLLLFQKSSTQALIPVVVTAKALMPTMLVQEHKDKTITHTVHEVLTWFG